MDRVALFVDAGYLLAAGGLLCCNERRRSRVEVAYGPLISMLGEQAEAHSQLPLLRTYWYDAARDQRPSTDHLTVAGLPSTKLRLGRLSGTGVQKGTDALIYRDLHVLSRQRAMATALLVAGDEDVREGVVAAQEMGVRVTVVGVAAGPNEVNQSFTLRAEADDNLVLSLNDLAPFFRLRAEPAQPQVLLEAVSLEAAAGRGVGGLESDADACARAFARKLIRTDPGGASEVRASYPRIPRPVDAALLAYVERHVGKLHGDEARRRAMRHGFWREIRGAQ